MGPEEALAAAAAGGQRDGALGEAKGVLREILAGGPMPATEVKRQAGQAGISPPTLRRARAGLGVRLERKEAPGGGGHWIWALPQDPR